MAGSAPGRVRAVAPSDDVDRLELVARDAPPSRGAGSAERCAAARIEDGGHAGLRRRLLGADEPQDAWGHAIPTAAVGEARPLGSIEAERGGLPGADDPPLVAGQLPKRSVVD